MAKPRSAGTLEAAMAELVAAVGGQVRAATITGLSQQFVFAATDDAPENRRKSLSVRAVAELEAAAGIRPVTEWMAHQTGCVLLPVIVPAADDNVAADMAAIGERVSALFARYASALSNDGSIDAREAATMLAQLDPGLRAILNMRRALLDIIRQERAPALALARA